MGFEKEVIEKPRKAAPKGLESYSIADLLNLRAEIDALLPAMALKDLNLEQELVLQFQSVRALQNEVLIGEGIPSNQKAQVANACAAALSQLVKMQSEYYTSERFKAIEGILIKTLKRWPDKQVAEFFKEYEVACK